MVAAEKRFELPNWVDPVDVKLRESFEQNLAPVSRVR
jgi:hypothetical protein